MPLLQLENVSKSYANHEALSDVSFSIPQGTIYGLLGPNGAGKTSLLRIVTTVLRADEGTVTFDDHPLTDADTKDIGYLPEERGLYTKMSVKDNVTFFAGLKGVTKEDALNRLDTYLKEFEMTPWKEEGVQNLSKGMQQKIQFIITVLHDPKLLILDEPFSGLDPLNADLLQRKVKKLRDNGTTIIFSTHRMEQVESLCEDICLISQGTKLIEGKVKDLKHRFKPHQVRLEFSQEVPSALTETFSVIEAPSETERIIQLQETEDIRQVISFLAAENVHISSLSEVFPSLQEIFVQNVTEAK